MSTGCPCRLPGNPISALPPRVTLNSALAGTGALGAAQPDLVNLARGWPGEAMHDERRPDPRTERSSALPGPIDVSA